MTAPIRSMPEDKINGRFEIYRVATDMEALQDAVRDRVDDLQTTRESLDAVGELQPGYSAKVLCNPAIKTLGKVSLGKMLKATGLALIIVIDDERFAALKAQLEKRRRPMPANAGSKRPTWLFSKDKAREMGKRRFSLMTESERKRHQRKAGKASGRARRRKAKHATVISEAKPVSPPAQ